MAVRILAEKPTDTSERVSVMSRSQRRAAGHRHCTHAGLDAHTAQIPQTCQRGTRHHFSSSSQTAGQHMHHMHDHDQEQRARMAKTSTKRPQVRGMHRRTALYDIRDQDERSDFRDQNFSLKLCRSTAGSQCAAAGARGDRPKATRSNQPRRASASSNQSFAVEIAPALARASFRV